MYSICVQACSHSMDLDRYDHSVSQGSPDVLFGKLFAMFVLPSYLLGSFMSGRRPAK